MDFLGAAFGISICLTTLICQYVNAAKTKVETHDALKNSALYATSNCNIYIKMVSVRG